MHNRLVQSFKKIEFFNDRFSYKITTGRWYRVVLINIHAPTKNINKYNIIYLHPSINFLRRHILTF